MSKEDELPDVLNPAKNPMIKVPYRTPEEQAAAEAWALRNLDQRAPFAPLGGDDELRELAERALEAGNEIRVSRNAAGEILVDGKPLASIGDDVREWLRTLKSSAE